MLTASEYRIEQESCSLIQKMLQDPDATPKHGQDGWPDRQVLLGNGRHYWLEFKKPTTGKLRAAQRERIAQLRARGELVGEPRSVAEALSFHAFAVSTLLGSRT